MAAIFRSSLQTLSPLPDLKLSSLTLQFHGPCCFVKSAKSKTTDFSILVTKFKTKVLNLSLSLDLSSFVKLAPRIRTHQIVIYVMDNLGCRHALDCITTGFVECTVLLFLSQ